MIDITKVILLIISIVSFVGLIMYVVKSFLATCPVKTHYSNELNRCVKDCDKPLKNDIDGTCVCPNPNEQYVGGNCVPKCPKDKPKLCSVVNKCYSEIQQTCLKDNLCNNEQVCGDNCCTPENGQPTTCSNGDIIFKTQDSFIVIEDNSKNLTITIKAGNYSTTDSTSENYYPTVLAKLLTNASGTSKNNYVYTVTLDGDKLTFKVSNNTTGFQPSFNFPYEITTKPSNFGFDFTTEADLKKFSANTLTSNDLARYVCYITGCSNGQEVCGDYGCCDPDSCLKHNEVSICCDKKTHNICGTGPNGSCCPKDQVCCGDVCCGDGEICGKDGKCKIACLFKDRDTRNTVYCDPSPKDQEKTGDYCVDMGDKYDPNAYSYCGHNKCIIKPFQPDPPNVVSNSVKYGVQPTIIPVCKSSDGKLYSGNSTLNLGFGLTRTLDITFDQTQSEICTKNDCEQLYKYEYGLEHAHGDENNTKCNATYRCADILDYNDKQNNGKCPFENTTQCCFDSNGNFTGQVCPFDTISYFNGSGFDCIKGWRQIDISAPGHGKKCVPVGENESTPDPIYSVKCTPGVSIKECCQSSCTRGFIGENCDQVIYNNDQVKNLLNNMPYIVQQYSGNFENLFNALSDQQAGFFSNSPYTYILVYCINESGGRYYNYCANNSMNYWTDDTPIAGFYKTLGEDIGDLVYNAGGVGFWWNTDTCANPPTGSNTRYISINSDGTLRSESGLGSGVKFFPNVYVLPLYQRSDQPGRTYKTYKTLGVLLIYGP
jgi:hypothetical protein